METQRREAVEAQRRHDETLAKLRHDAAARMREAALSRHQLLQQVDALTTSNGTSDTAVVQSFIRLFTAPYTPYNLSCKRGFRSTIVYRV